MAKFNNNVLTHGLRGAIGDLVFRQRDGITIVSRKPSPRRRKTLTDGEKKVRSKFQMASTYARAAIRNPEIERVYQAARKAGQTAYNVAFQDAYHAPDITKLDTDTYFGQPGDSILVQAIDNFKVESVQVCIISATGVLIEKGLAVMEANGLDWRYTCQELNLEVPGTVIRAIASDLARNRTGLEVVLK